MNQWSKQKKKCNLLIFFFCLWFSFSRIYSSILNSCTCALGLRKTVQARTQYWAIATNTNYNLFRICAHALFLSLFFLCILCRLNSCVGYRVVAFVQTPLCHCWPFWYVLLRLSFHANAPSTDSFILLVLIRISN